MPVKLAYQEFLDETIKNLHQGQRLDVQTILCQVFESLMESERAVFLNESLDNKGNGFYSRFINHLQGRFEIKIPRDRRGQFYPLTLEIIKQDSARMDQLALSLYSQGVSHRGVSHIFKDLFSSHYSPGKLSQLVKAFEPLRLSWQRRILSSHYHVILIDALYHAVRRDDVAQEATYIVMGLKEDYSREILGLYHLPRESAEGWKQVFQDLKQRGFQQVGLVLCDELSGIEVALEQYLPHRAIQCCLVHKVRRLITYVRHKDKAHLMADWHEVLDLDNPFHTPAQFQQRLTRFIDQWAKRYPSIRGSLPEYKWRYYHQYLNYPVQLRRMLYTTNWIERFNKEVRKTTQHVNSFPNPDAALNLIFMVSKQMEEKTYRIPITSFYPFKQHMEKILFGLSQTQNY